ncbi:MAG: redox-sensing transcriptional repressor Rex [Phycisphaerales bacterium]|jgi:redox-sensing transcriptional repressor|nr:redox-sensing transcriptional repressor Rex [Phycisphaerales bacterium]
MPPPAGIPRPTVQRLSLYLRELESAQHDGRHTISSSAIARAFGFTDAQVRRDLGCLGQTGRPGVGYQTAFLASRIRGALSLDRTWNLAIVGTGKIGSALMRYPRFAGGGFKVVAAFDADPALCGQTIAGVDVRPLSQLAEGVAEANVQLAVLAVPAEFAQAVADQLVAAGIQGILNFAPAALRVDVPVEPIDLSRALEQLAFRVSSEPS